MKRFTKPLLALLVFVAVAVLGMVALVSSCFRTPDENHILRDVIRAARELRPDGDNADDGTPGSLLGPDDAAFLRYVAATRRAVPAPEAYKPPADDELTKRLFAEAERRKLGPEGRPAGEPWGPGRSTLGPDPASVPDATRATFLRTLDAHVREIGERVAAALADQAVGRHLRAMAELHVVHSDLVSAGGKDVPDDPLALLPPEYLDRANEAIAPLTRMFAKETARLDTPVNREMRGHIASQVARYAAVRESAEYAKFHKGGAGLRALARQIPKADWDALRQEGFDARVQAQLVRQEAVAATLHGPWRAFWSAHQQRGPPPDSPAARLYDVIRYHDLDLDTAAALRAAARVAAAESELGSLSKDHAVSGLPGHQRILATLGEADLHGFRNLVGMAQAAVASQGPATGGSLFLKDWADAAAAETARRAVVGSERFDAAPLVRGVVDQHLKGRAAPLTREAKAKHLARIQERFPNYGNRPVSVHAEMSRLVAEVALAYSQRIRTAYEQYTELAYKAPLATGPLSAEVATGLDIYRKRWRQLAREFRDYVWTAEDQQVEIPREVTANLALLTVAFFGPDNPPPEPLVLANSPGPKPKGGGPGVALEVPPAQTLTNPYKPRLRHSLLTADPWIDYSLVAVEGSYTTLKPQLDRESVEPPRFAVEKGRYSVPRKTLTHDTELVLKYDPKLTRLPATESEYYGRLKVTGEGKATKVPYDFLTEVWNYNSLRAVGGGIHFGATGRYDGPPLSGHVLRYDLKRQELVLTGPPVGRAAPTVHRMAGVRPEVLKPLFQFAHAGRNAAISIGWGQDRRAGSAEGQVVLLDPYLVDTPTGRDLVLADSIPWEFDTKPLSPEKLASFGGQFRDLVTASTAVNGQQLGGVLKDLPVYRREDVAGWAREHEAELGEDPQATMTQAVLLSSSAEAAKKLYVERVALQDAKAQIDEQSKGLGFRGATGSSVAELEQAALNVYMRLGRDANRPGSIERNGAAARAFVARLLQQIRTGLTKHVEEEGLFKWQPLEHDRAVFEVVASQLRSSVGCPVPLLRLCVAARTAGEWNGDQEAAVRELLGLSQTTLAVLMDDPGEATVTLAGGKLVASGTMRYRYARTRVTVVGDRVYFGKVPGDDREVEPLVAVNDLVNGNYRELELGFAPLGRVARDAQLTALLRWAIAAKKDGRLGGLDLSELAGTPARDRAKSPTPDLLTSGNK